MLPKSIEELILALRLFPGIGEKTANRLAFFLLKKPVEIRQKISSAILKAEENLKKCQICGNLSDQNFCQICQNPNRNKKIICVVEDFLDLLAIEKTKTFRGTFHILGGAISPADSIGPNDLQIKNLINRIKNQQTSELILATNPNFEGEATAYFIFKQCQKFTDLKITRLARGIPVGGDVEYTDQNTLSRAIENRSNF